MHSKSVSSLHYRTAYWDDLGCKEAFNTFINDIHNLHLRRWDEMGYWDDNYRPFSFFEDDRVVSSVCVYSLEMMIRGSRCRVAQISGVGTMPEFRRRGLNAELTRRAIRWAEPNHDFFFLFADDEARPFYKACGFRAVHETRERYPVNAGQPNGGVRKFDPDNLADRDFIYSRAVDRAAISDQLGVLNPGLLMYWCLYFLEDSIYYVPDLDLIVLYKRQDGMLSVYDIIGSEIPPFSRLYPYLADPDDTGVLFHFMTDKLGMSGQTAELVPCGVGTHVLGSFPFEGQPFQFPYTAHA